MTVYINFHTIMEAEAALEEQPVVIIQGIPFSFEWGEKYSMDKELAVGFFDDFPVDELLQLFQPYAAIERMYKVPEHPELVIVRPTTYTGTRLLQRVLHGALFRGRPLYVGSELPGCKTLTSKMYHPLRELQSSANLHYEAPLVTEVVAAVVADVTEVTVGTVEDTSS